MKPDVYKRSLLAITVLFFSFMVSSVFAETKKPIVIISIDGPISPASDDFLKTSLQSAKEKDAALFVLKLNTPGGLLPSMQTMVGRLLETPIPTLVYVSPRGSGAISAGVFITLAANFAAMAPTTTIGAAHPVVGSGEDIQGDMRAKVENFAATHIKTIAEQRGRNVTWAEEAVRKSVAITEREAVEKKVVDFIAEDLDSALKLIEGRKTKIAGKEVTVSGLIGAEQIELEMSFKQQVVNVLADPNIAILLGLAAMIGIGAELYSPGLIFPGIVGVICLILSLTSTQVLPINQGGAGLLLLSAVFFGVELAMPTFGIWGIAGVVCLVLGSIYLIDTDLVWGVDSIAVDSVFVGSIAALAGMVVLSLVYLAISATRRKVSTGKEGLVGQRGVVTSGFSGSADGKVRVSGELWYAQLEQGVTAALAPGDEIEVVKLDSGMVLVIKPRK